MSNLEAKIREQVRLCFLRYLDAAAPRALSEPLLAQMARADGFNVSRDQAWAELEYLRGKGFIEAAQKAISPENRQWKSTPAGQDHYAIIANG
jgi:hypothetical protein